MGTLFDITAEMRSLYDLATEDGDPAALADTLESMMPELQQKAAAYVAVINQLDMEANKAEQMARDFEAKAKARKNSIKAMKNALLMAMDTIDATEMAAGDFTIKVAKNGGRAPLKIFGEVPDSMTKIIVEPDTEKIRAFLDTMPDQRCEWAALLERGRHITIK